MGRLHVAISDQTLSCDAALDFVDGAANGAACAFIGRVRDRNLGRPVRAVTYDAFAPLAVETFRAICREVWDNWGDGLDIWVEHFQGRLAIGGASVVIAVGSPHRDESFLACRYIIDEIKCRSPIWKQEHFADGASEWSAGHALGQIKPSNDPDISIG